LDESFKDALSGVQDKEFPAIDDAKAEEMKEKIEQARMDQDSVGGIVETVIYGLEGGLGGPIFDGLEGKIASILFAIPAVKGVEFGNGFEAAGLRGSENNDPFMFDDHGNIRLKTNRSGGIQGGITVGGSVAPVVFDCAFKPTPSIGKEQETVDIKEKKNTTLTIEGRHDPCIVPRAVPVTEAAAAIAVYALLLSKER
jgi:chorismate synthase